VHELSLVAELVAECERRAAGAPVSLVRVRCATTIPEAALREAFRLLTADGPLAAATLEAELLEVELRCPCDFAGTLGDTDLVGHLLLAVCPACGAVSSHEHAAEVHLLAVHSGP
jgi:Zn finger protein HypA/HybF involved in hydrogenase expression